MRVVAGAGSMLEVLLAAYLQQAATEKETGLVLGHSRGLLTWSTKYLEASAKIQVKTEQCLHYTHQILVPVVGVVSPDSGSH